MLSVHGLKVSRGIGAQQHRVLLPRLELGAGEVDADPVESLHLGGPLAVDLAGIDGPGGNS